MYYTSTYTSPVGKMLLAVDENAVVGVWFEGGKYFARFLDKDSEKKETSVTIKLKHWLDIYFSGKKPDFELPLRMIGTPFQIEVWSILQKIPYGTTTTYKDVANQIAKNMGINRMSAQAVGTAVGKNNISIVIPCHRVIASNNGLSGYAGGIEKKIALLELEREASAWRWRAGSPRRRLI